MPLSPELTQRIRAEFPKYPEKRAVLLTALHFVQEECGGWVPKAAVPELAALLEIPEIDVWDVISFYSMFYAEPVGRYHLQVCTNLPCCVRGARGVVRALERALDLRPGERTEDGMFSLREVECLGSCGTAPVLQVNNRRYDEGLAPGDVDGLVARLRAEASASTQEKS
ncbi:MAG TPA: NADH-quinone oxidoreductase subunit NuoE [Candidatus Methylomirabilis sp.]|nr:NADH-quinone oxidoreductase subunit NuoE [Candidatus Methylomirabilis sp.]